jgi:cellulose synthase operon protein C
MSRGVSNVWIEKSLQKLAKSVPARYDKPEETSGILSSLETYIFATDRPAPADSDVAKTEESDTVTPAQAEEPGSVTESDTAAPAQAEEPGSVTESEIAEPAQGDRTGQPPIRTGEATRR